MSSVNLNILLYLVPLLVYWSRYRRFDFYVLIMLLYMVTATMCSLFYHQEPYEFKNTTFLGFLYLFLVLYIMFLPIKGKSIDARSFIIIDNNTLKILSYIFIVASFTGLMMSIPRITETFQTGDWGAIRNLHDEDEIVYYSSQGERLAKNIGSYLTPFGLVYAFYQLSKPKIKKAFVFLLFSAIIVPTFFEATIEASRGMLMHLMINLGITYMLFRPIIPQTRKKIVYSITLVIVAVFLTYSLAVTVSRFGEDRANSSLFMYFGHSMLAFNDGIFNSMHSYAGGKRFFYWFIELFGGNPAFSSASLGSTAGTAFFTIVGGMYIDWGPWGTIVAAIIACFIANNWFRRKTIMLSDTVVMVFYLSTLANGIFVFGKGRALYWFMTFVVYLIVRQSERIK